jgi:hypothetical protein
VEDTWASRDLPVLDATVRLLETMDFPSARDIAAEAGMDAETTARALEALDGTFLDLSRTLGSPENWHVNTVYAEARRAVGQWPTAESLITQLAGAFSTAAEREPDPEKKSRLRSIAGVLGGAGRDIAVEVAARVVEHQMGVGLARLSSTTC